jgi:hypothetical protein
MKSPANAHVTLQSAAITALNMNERETALTYPKRCDAAFICATERRSWMAMGHPS